MSGVRTCTTSFWDGGTPLPQLSQLEKKVDPSLVDILGFLVAQPGEQQMGTGIILSSGGEILTCYHVISGVSSLWVRVGGVGKVYGATILRTNPALDLALLQVHGASP